MLAPAPGSDVNLNATHAVSVSNVAGQPRSVLFVRMSVPSNTTGVQVVFQALNGGIEYPGNPLAVERPV
jgi:hypothetical protein